MCIFNASSHSVLKEFSFQDCLVEFIIIKQNWNVERQTELLPKFQFFKNPEQLLCTHTNETINVLCTIYKCELWNKFNFEAKINQTWFLPWFLRIEIFKTGQKNKLLPAIPSFERNKSLKLFIYDFFMFDARSIIAGSTPFCVTKAKTLFEPTQQCAIGISVLNGSFKIYFVHTNNRNATKKMANLNFSYFLW